VAKSPDFVKLVQELADLVAAEGQEAVATRQESIDDLKITLKENIDLGQVIRFDAAPGNAVDTYVHVQSGRGVNGIIVELAGGDTDLAHDVALTAAFSKPQFVSRDQVPAEAVEAEREMIEKMTRAEGKPEAALPKIIEGRLNGWYKERVLLDQPFVKDEKQTVQQALGGATIANFAQVVIG
jgi:elongation factor Ts